MSYTFTPKQKCAKAKGTGLRISTKDAAVICRVIRNKPLARAKRLLQDISSQKRNLKGKYYSNAVSAILGLVESCEKNAEFLGLEQERLFVHASARKGPNIRRRRRKASFGSKIKSTHVEVMLIEKGKEPKTKVAKKQLRAKANDVREEMKKESEQMKREIAEMKEHGKGQEEAVEAGLHDNPKQEESK